MASIGSSLYKCTETTQKGKGVINQPADDLHNREEPRFVSRTAHYRDSISRPEVIRLSRKRMAEEIIAHLQLTVYSKGIQKLDDINKVAWIRMEVPDSSKSENFKMLKIFGDTKQDNSDAEESLGEKIIEIFTEDANFIIDDLNRDKLAITKAHLDHTTLWSQEMHKKYNMLHAQNAALSKSEDKILSCLAYICTSYDDILPFSSNTPVMQASNIPPTAIQFNGSHPPATRIEELAKDLLDLLLDHTNRMDDLD